jgi:MFS family permease
MTTDTLGTPPRTTTLGPAIVPLLGLVILINYVDRGNLATAAPLIKDQLGLSATEIGLLLSAFFWSYTPGQILAGWLSERINPYRTLALGLALWALATAASGLATGFASLLALRVLLGLGESAAFPCTAKLLAQHLPIHKLGVANSLSSVGLGLGPAFGTFAGGLLIAEIGWRNVFLLFGLISLLWLVPWWATTREASARADISSGDRAPSYAAIMRCREAWGASLGHFCGNYAIYFMLSWIPLYLVKARGISVTHMAEIGGLIYLAYSASICFAGWLADRLVRAGANASRVRKISIVGGLTVTAASFLVTAIGSSTVSIASLFCAGTAFGFCTPNIWAIGQILAGPRAAGKWAGLQNCIANLAGIVAPVVTGLVVDRTGQFFWAFVVAAAVSLAGTLAWGVLIREIAPVKFRSSLPVGREHVIL